MIKVMLAYEKESICLILSSLLIHFDVEVYVKVVEDIFATGEGMKIKISPFF